jgi:ribosomal protein S4
VLKLIALQEQWKMAERLHKAVAEDVIQKLNRRLPVAIFRTSSGD